MQIRQRHSPTAVASRIAGQRAFAQDENADFAKKLANPIADLFSVPFQFNWESGDACYYHKCQNTTLTGTAAERATQALHGNGYSSPAALWI
jgi:hypothetical protein